MGTGKLSQAEMVDTLPGKAEGEDMIFSLWRHRAGVLAHRGIPDTGISGNEDNRAVCKGFMASLRRILPIRP